VPTTTSSAFRVAFFVDDSKLGSTLRKLIALGIKDIDSRPVPNAQITKGKIKATSDGSLAGNFLDHARKNGLTTFKARDIKAMLPAIGGKPSSITYLMKVLIKQGEIRKSGKGTATTYHLKGAE
jgi:hypothetical protein